MKRIDLVVIGTVLALAAILLLLFRAPSGAEGYAVVYVNDEEYARLPLDTPATLTIDQGDGKVNVVEIFKGGVRMQSASCHNQLCVPNGVSIELVAEDAP